MNPIATASLQLHPEFTDAPMITYFPNGNFFSIWWGLSLSLILSSKQLEQLRDALNVTTQAALPVAEES